MEILDARFSSSALFRSIKSGQHKKSGIVGDRNNLLVSDECRGSDLNLGMLHCIRFKFHTISKSVLKIHGKDRTRIWRLILI